MFVEDLKEDFELVTDSQDIKAVLDSIGKMDMYDEVGCLFVLVGDGDYDKVYYCESSVPYLTEYVYEI